LQVVEEEAQAVTNQRLRDEQVVDLQEIMV
jgi:hypothetical protein